MNQLIKYIFLVLLVSCGSSKPSETPETDPTSLANQTLSDRFSYLLDHKVDSLAFPRSLEKNGEVRGTPSKDWTSGFFPGSLMFIHQITSYPGYLSKAEEWLPFIRKEQINDKTHDMGFKVFCSYGNAYRLTSNPEYAEVIVASATTLITRFDPEVGCIKSWDFGKDQWTFPVIIDNMMNLELLFEATKISGDSAFHKIADSHATITLKNHFRDNNSSYHVIDYNPETGQVLNKLTHQGLNAESSWARGQAWGLYGFTMSYRYTKNRAYLDQANAIADYIFAHPNLPEDLVPYWDFDDPKIPDAPRDASAASIIASALFELSEYTPERRDDYLKGAQDILASLSSTQYLLPEAQKVPFLLIHATGNMPKNDEIDVPINYADYYFLEALLRAEKFATD